MPANDTTQLKEKILQTLRRKGPSLPVHIANETGLSILFASAFLSELISDRKIKISNLRVGSSPVYFIPGQEVQLEKYSHHLKSREKDAYNLLKEKKFLEDSKQDPAIRVALRQIKDFAIGFQKDNKIFWRFFTIPESEFKDNKSSEPKKEVEEKIFKEIKKEDYPSSEQIPNSLLTEIRKNLEEKQETKELDIFDKEDSKEEKEIKKEKKKPAKKKVIKKKTAAKKKDDKFFNKVKEFLNEKSIEILDIESFNKNDLILKVKKQGKEELLFAYNKRKIEESDIIKAAKKAEDEKINYTLLSLGGPLKKVENLIDAVKNLSSIEKL